MIAAPNSANTEADQIPSTESSSGSKKIASISKTKARTTAMIPETSPLFNAVKNADPNMLKPQNKNTKE